MPRKLYLFGIGGTGSRVIKAFTMLLASGVKLKNDFETVVPIIIDPDVSNGDLNRTKDILRLYQEIQNEIHEPISFFSQKVKTINELATDSGVINPEYYHFKLEGVEDSNFGDYIGFNNLSDNYMDEEDDKNFLRLLFSSKNLASNLDVGFKGNPNMGAVVLDQFTRSSNFNRFASTFAEGDAIFIVNSIFGGTGAAGYPLLLKNLRGNEDLPRHDKIKEAHIGAMTMLPYFALNAQDEINSESFEQKAVAAIDYYNRTIINKNEIDYQYFIGNKGNTNFEAYSVGGKEQKNRAHFLELASALSILDFCNLVTDERLEKTQVKEFGIENFDDSILTFNDLNADNVKQMAKELTKFKLFTDYFKIGLPKSQGKARWTKKGFIQVFGKKELDYSTLDKKYFESAAYQNQIEKYNEYFDEWLGEMNNNDPSFSPFNEITHDNALSIVKDHTPEKEAGYEVIDITNNKLIAEQSIRNTNGKKHTTLVKLFDTSIEKALKNYNILQKEKNNN